MSDDPRDVPDDGAFPENAGPLYASGNARSTDYLIVPVEDEPALPQDLSPEEERLGSRNPLPTIVYLSIGPLISQLTGALFPIVNTLWVSKTVGDQGLTALSMYLNFDTISRGFAFFLQVAASTQISSLFGSNQRAEASRVFSDLIRLTLLCAILIAVGFVFIAKPTVRWFRASDDIVELGFRFILPNLLGGFVPCLFLFACGCLQAEGRSWVFSAVQITSMVLNMLAFSPFFLFVCKTGIAGVSYSALCAEFIPAAVIIVLYYRGKFGIRPELGDLFKRPIRESWAAVKVGGSQLVFQLSQALPGIILRKFFGEACAAAGDCNLDDLMAGYNPYCRIWTVVVSVSNAVAIGFLPAASYAAGARRFTRIVHLLIHAAWISIAWSLFTMVFTLGFPEPLVRIFSETPGYVSWAVFIMHRCTYTAWATPLPIVVNALLQSLQYGGLASIFTLAVQTIPLPVISSILFFTERDNPERIFWCMIIHQAYAALVSIPFVIFAIRQVRKRAGEADAAPAGVVLDDIGEKQQQLIEGESTEV
jgi:Na+-driven multidrug efflux pump